LNPKIKIKWSELLAEYAEANDPIKKTKEVAVVKKKKNEDVCHFCGPYEVCSKNRHTPEYLRDLLVDAGILPDTETAFNKWWTTNHSPQDPFNLLMSYNAHIVYGVYPHKVAEFVRSIL